MKKILSILIVVSALLFLTGCATTGPVGSLYTGVKLPVQATSNASYKADSPKVGVSECISVLGLIATGDASIAAAKKNGNITKVHHVDWDAENILGLFGTYKCTVYGE